VNLLAACVCNKSVGLSDIGFERDVGFGNYGDRK